MSGGGLEPIGPIVEAELSAAELRCAERRVRIAAIRLLREQREAELVLARAAETLVNLRSAA